MDFHLNQSIKQMVTNNFEKKAMCINSFFNDKYWIIISTYQEINAIIHEFLKQDLFYLTNLEFSSNSMGFYWKFIEGFFKVVILKSV